MPHRCLVDSPPLSVEIFGCVITKRGDTDKLNLCVTESWNPRVRGVFAHAAGFHLSVFEPKPTEGHEQVSVLRNTIPTREWTARNGFEPRT